MINSISELYRYRELLGVWTLREVRVRYKQSILGGAWAILQPLALMVIVTIVFGYFVKIPTGGIPYPLFSYSALLPWTFFATSITFAVMSIVGNMNLVTKIYFPREILPIASIGAAFFDYCIAFLMYLVMVFFYRVPLHTTILLLPLLLIVQILLTSGIAFFASALLVFFRDVRFIIPLILQLWFFLCPIVYPLNMVPQRFLFLYQLNPMAVLIENYRLVTLLGQQPRWDTLGLAFILSFLIFFSGYLFFKRNEAAFADII